MISLRLPSPLHDASESKLQLSFTEIIYHNEDFNLCYYYTLRQICLYPSLFFSQPESDDPRQHERLPWCCFCSDWLSLSPNYPFKETDDLTLLLPTDINWCRLKDEATWTPLLHTLGIFRQQEGVKGLYIYCVKGAHAHSIIAQWKTLKKNTQKIFVLDISLKCAW